MNRYPAILVLVTALALALASCGRKDAPAAAAAAPAEAEEEMPKLHVPDACSLLDVDNVANVSGWKGLKAVKVDTGAEYLSACSLVDGTDPARFVKIAVAIGSDEPKDSVEYAQIVGDRSGTLQRPAKAVTNLGVPVIEMDGGPGAQAMQTRMKPVTELTITTPTMQLTRTLFPAALIELRKQLVTDS